MAFLFLLHQKKKIISLTLKTYVLYGLHFVYLFYMFIIRNLKAGVGNVFTFIGHNIHIF